LSREYPMAECLEEHMNEEEAEEEEEDPIDFYSQ
jgi:hypothetical protein